MTDWRTKINSLYEAPTNNEQDAPAQVDYTNPWGETPTNTETQEEKIDAPTTQTAVAPTEAKTETPSVMKVEAPASPKDPFAPKPTMYEMGAFADAIKKRQEAEQEEAQQRDHEEKKIRAYYDGIKDYGVKVPSYDVFRKEIETEQGRKKYEHATKEWEAKVDAFAKDVQDATNWRMQKEGAITAQGSHSARAYRMQPQKLVDGKWEDAKDGEELSPAKDGTGRYISNLDGKYYYANKRYEPSDSIITKNADGSYTNKTTDAVSDAISKGKGYQVMAEEAYPYLAEYMKTDNEKLTKTAIKSYFTANRQGTKNLEGMIDKEVDEIYNRMRQMHNDADVAELLNESSLAERKQKALEERTSQLTTNPYLDEGWGSTNYELQRTPGKENEDVIKDVVADYELRMRRKGYQGVELQEMKKAFEVQAVLAYANLNTNERTSRLLAPNNKTAQSIIKSGLDILGGVKDSFYGKIVNYKVRPYEQYLDNMTNVIDQSNMGELTSTLRFGVAFGTDTLMGKYMLPSMAGGIAGNTAVAYTNRFIAGAQKLRSLLMRSGMTAATSREIVANALLRSNPIAYGMLHGVASGAVTFGLADAATGMLDPMFAPTLSSDNEDVARMAMSSLGIESAEGIANFDNSDTHIEAGTRLAWNMFKSAASEGAAGGFNGLFFVGGPIGEAIGRGRNLAWKWLGDATKIGINAGGMTLAQAFLSGDYSVLGLTNAYRQNLLSLSILDGYGVIKRASNWRKQMHDERNAQYSDEQTLFMQENSIPQAVDIPKAIADGSILNLPQPKEGQKRVGPTVHLFKREKNADGTTKPLTAEQQAIEDSINGYLQNTSVPKAMRAEAEFILTGEAHIGPVSRLGATRVDPISGRGCIDLYNTNGELITTRYYKDVQTADKNRENLQNMVILNDMQDVFNNYAMRKATGTFDKDMQEEWLLIQNKVANYRRIERKMKSVGKIIEEGLSEHEKNVAYLMEHAELINSIKPGEQLTDEQAKVLGVANILMAEQFGKLNTMAEEKAAYETANGMHEGEIDAIMKGYKTEEEARKVAGKKAKVQRINGRWYTKSDIETMQSFKEYVQDLIKEDDVKKAEASATAIDAINESISKELDRRESDPMYAFQQKVDAVRQQIAADTQQITDESGNVVEIQVRDNDNNVRTAYVIKGKLSIDENGKVIKGDSDKAIAIRYEDGKPDMVSPDRVEGAKAPVEANAYIEGRVNEYVSANAPKPEEAKPEAPVATGKPTEGEKVTEKPAEVKVEEPQTEKPAEAKTERPAEPQEPVFREDGSIDTKAVTPKAVYEYYKAKGYGKFAESELESARKRLAEAEAEEITGETTKERAEQMAAKEARIADAREQVKFWEDVIKVGEGNVEKMRDAIDGKVRQITNMTDEERAAHNQSSESKGGVVITDDANAAGGETLTLLESIGQQLGIPIEFKAGITGNGQRISVNGKTVRIRLNPEAARPVDWVITHELTHHLRGYAEEVKGGESNAWTVLVDLVKESLGDDFQRQFDETRELYDTAINALNKKRAEGEKYDLLTDDEITEEIVGNHIADAVRKDPDFLRSLVDRVAESGESPVGLIERVRAFIDRMIEALKSIKNPTTFQKSQINALEEAKNMWGDIYEYAAKKEGESRDAISKKESEKKFDAEGGHTVVDAATVDEKALNVAETTQHSFSTEKALAQAIRDYAEDKDNKQGKGKKKTYIWAPEQIEDMVRETSDLVEAIHNGLIGDPNYDEFAKKEPTLRVDWRDGELKPIVTWSRNNIEYKYDASADTLCINNEGLETVLSSPTMAELMVHIAQYNYNPKAKDEGHRSGFSSEDYLRLYETLRDLGFVVPCKGCFDAAARFKMLPSVAQSFVDLVNKAVDQRNSNPEKFDEMVSKLKSKERTVNGLPAASENKEEAILIGVAGDQLTEHINWTQLMHAEGQTKALADWGGIFRAWQKTGAGRPKDKLMPEPYTGDLVSTQTTIIAPYGERTPSYRDIAVNVGTGLRRNSHSEFRPVLAIDELQFMRDAWLKNLCVFKYMKELDDVRLFGNTGAKYNMSGFTGWYRDANGKSYACGLDENGDYYMAEESVGGREFPYVGEDGNTHYDGKKGLEEAKKHINKDCSLSSVIMSIPHLIKAMTDVPTPSDKRGLWGSIIGFHPSGATAESLWMQGLGRVRALRPGTFMEEAFVDWHKGVLSFEDVQNDRFGEGWTFANGKKAGTDANGHKWEFSTATIYRNESKGITLYSSPQTFLNNGGNEDVVKHVVTNKSGKVKIDKKTGKPEKKMNFSGNFYTLDSEGNKVAHQIDIDYNNKVRELNEDYGYKSAADYYIEELNKIGIMPRFSFEVPEEAFLRACKDAHVDPRHPKLGWKGEGHGWNPADAESYYSLWCDFGMTDPETGKWSPHLPVLNGDKDPLALTKALPDNYLQIIQDGVNRYTTRKAQEDSRIGDAIEEFCIRSIEAGQMDAQQSMDILRNNGIGTERIQGLMAEQDVRQRAGDAIEPNAVIQMSLSSDLDEKYPDWRNQQTKKGGHNTQISGTTPTYTKIGEYLKSEGKGEATILDASSGKGLGTQALREAGFNIEDVEPFQENDRLNSENGLVPATYSSYDELRGKQYDVVISNAVLNVIPQDWRDNIVRQMADCVKVGGKMFVNTRFYAKTKGIELDDATEVLIPKGKNEEGKPTYAYQKFFTKPELRNYMQEMLGDGWTVETSTDKNSGIGGAPAVVCTKDYETTPDGGGKKQFSFAGVIGATALDAKDKGTRMKNLEGAKAMLDKMGGDYKSLDRSDKLRIKIATGWEQGADGKWRFETRGLKWKPQAFSMKWGKNVKLSDLLEDSELFAAYPELDDIKITRTKKASVSGVFYPDTNELKINTDDLGRLQKSIDFHMPLLEEARKGHFSEWVQKNFESTYGKPLTAENVSAYYKEHIDECEKDKQEILDDLQDTINHEVQHAIQRAEGFASGGNSDMDWEVLNAADPVVRDFTVLFGGNSRTKLLNAGYSAVMSAVRKSKEKASEEHKRRADNILTNVSASDFRNLVDDSARLYGRAHIIAIRDYEKLAGEVEARNAGRRAKMTDEERANSLGEDTEEKEYPRNKQKVQFKYGEGQAKESEQKDNIQFSIPSGKSIDARDVPSKIEELNAANKKIEKEGKDFLSTKELYGEKVTRDNYYNYTSASFHLLTDPFAKKTEIDSTWDNIKEQFGESVKSPKAGSKSEYVIDENSGDVYRYSDHWGKIATCKWEIDYPYNGIICIAKCNLNDFSRIDKKVINPEYEKNAQLIKDLHAGQVYTNGSYGTIHTEFKGDPIGAVEQLIKDQNGVALGVYHRDDIGDIDLVFGDYPNGIQGLDVVEIGINGNFKSIEEAVDAMTESIENGEPIKENADKIVLKERNHNLTIRKQVRDKKGKIIATTNWVVNLKKVASPRETLSTPSSNHTADGVTLPSSEVPSSADKGTTNSSNLQENAQEISQKDAQNGKTVQYALSKEAYQGKQRYVDRRMKENEEKGMANGLTEEQVDALESLCKARHDMHSNIEKLVTEADPTIVRNLQKAIDAVEDSGLERPQIKAYVGRYDDGDYIDIDDFNTLREMGVYPRTDEEINDESERIIGEWNELNNEIERYLGKIDKKYDTEYQPTGFARLQHSFTPGDRMRQRRGESLQEFLSRKQNYINLNVANAAEARKRTMEEIQSLLDDQRFKNINRSALNKMMKDVRDATDENIRETIKEVHRTMNQLSSRHYNREIERLINMRIQGKNGKNMSVAKNVDDATRKAFIFLKGKLSDFDATEWDEEQHSINTSLYRLRRERTYLQSQYDHSTDADEQRELQQKIDDNLNEQEGLKARLEEVQNNRLGAINANRPVHRKEVEDLIQDLDQKYNDHLTGNGEWTEDDDAMQMAAMLLNKRLELNDLIGDYDNTLLKRDNAQITLSALINQKKEGNKGPAMDNAIKNARRVVESLQALADDILQQKVEKQAEIAADLNNLIAEGKDSLKDKIQNERERKSGVILGFWQDITSGKFNPQLMSQKELKDSSNLTGFGDKMRGFARGVFGSFEYMAQHMAKNSLGQDSWFYRYFMQSENGVMAAADTFNTGIRESMGEMNDKAQEIFGKKFDKVMRDNAKVIEHTGIYKTVEAGGMEVSMEQPMSKGQATYLYMVWKMPDGRAKLEHMGFDAESIARAKEFIGPENVAWADWVQSEFLTKLRDKYNKKYAEMYNTSMANIDNYVPLKILGETRHQAVDVSEVMGAQTLNQKAGSLINRTHNLNDVDLTMSAYEIVAEHIKNMEEWNAYARVRQDLNYILSSTAIRNQLNLNETASFDRLKKAAQIATLTYKSETPDASTWVNTLTKGLAGANIAFRNTTALKQMLSMPAFFGYSQDPAFMARLMYNTLGQYAYHIPTFVATMATFGEAGRRAMKDASADGPNKATTRVALSDTVRWCIENLPSFRNRVSKGSVGNVILDELLSDDRTKWDRFKQRLAQDGMAANGLVDAVTCAIGIKTIYDYRYNQLKSAAKKEFDNGEIDFDTYNERLIEADRMAKSDADIYYNGTQQSNHPAFLAPVQMDGDIASKMYTLYKNSPISYARKAVLPVQDLWKLRNWNTLQNNEANHLMKTKGMTYDEAMAEANKHLTKEMFGSVFRLGLYGYVINWLWNWGGKGLLGMFQDEEDDEDKNAAQKTAEALAPVLTGVPAVDLVVNTLAGQDVEPLLLYDVQKRLSTMIAKQEGSISQEMIYDIVNNASRIGVGVDLTSLANTYLGVEQLIKDAKAAPEDRTLLVDAMLFLNTPNSNRKQVARKIYAETGCTEDEFEKAVLLAEKTFAANDWHTNLPSAKVVDDKKLKEIRKDYINRTATDEEKARMEYKESVSKDAIRKQYPNINELQRAFDAEKDPVKKRNMGEVLKDMWNEPGKDKSADKIKADMLGIAGEDKATEDIYMNHATSADIAEDNTLTQALAALRPIWDEYVDLGRSSTTEGHKFYNNHLADIRRYHVLSRYAQNISRMKARMKHVKDDASIKAIMDRIAEVRRTAINGRGY